MNGGTTTPDETPGPAERPQAVRDEAAEHAVRDWRALLERLRHT